MTRIMMRLGPFKFSIDTAAYQSLTRSTAFRWQAQERFGRLPAQQYTGPGEDSVTLKGDIYPTYAGGLGQIDAMREAAAKGEPLLWVDGYGYVLGKWCIKSVDEEQGTFLPGGAPQKMSFTLQLTRYGDDDA